MTQVLEFLTEELRMVLFCLSAPLLALLFCLPAPLYLLCWLLACLLFRPLAVLVCFACLLVQGSVLSQLGGKGGGNQAHYRLRREPTKKAPGGFPSGVFFIRNSRVFGPNIAR